MNDILADFARWYADAPVNGSLPAAPPGVDVSTILGHFVALRQEVNLQTRSVRTQQEQSSQFIREVQESLRELEKPPPPPAPAPADDKQDVLRPAIKTLVEVYDALATAGMQIQKARTSLSAPPADGLANASPRKFWGEWFLSPTAEQAIKATEEQELRRRDQAEASRKAYDRVAVALDGLVLGYTMSMERVERVLRQFGLEPIPAVGEQFDPELMEALEAVPNTGRPNNEVVGEVRRGYMQNGRVFRCAVVRVAKTL